MKQHLYRLTLEPIGAESTVTPLSFEVASPDDMIAVVDRIRMTGDFDRQSASALGVGLKLFSGALLQHRDHPLFATFLPHFVQFMKEVKQARPPSAGG